MRLDKYLCDSLLITRNEAKKIIRQNKITVGSKTISDAGYHVDSEDNVCFESKALVYKEFRYVAMNKPSGYITATNDKKDKTVNDLLNDKLRRAVVPAGRLDKDTEGLLLFTNDGKLAHDLLSPSGHVHKTYLCVLAHEIDNDSVKLLEEGVDIGDDKPTAPASCKKTGDHTVLLTICEGRFHQVKRMFHAVGNEVVKLTRVSFGPLELSKLDLKTGEYRELTAEEEALLKTANG
ncbi:MAG: rRNA pseudouridine synthase [Lachnospiraceae bacterium]|nr:rRNA pseudouridine synthase [Lachnospiraceae bacterium]